VTSGVPESEQQSVQAFQPRYRRPSGMGERRLPSIFSSLGELSPHAQYTPGGRRGSGRIADTGYPRNSTSEARGLLS
jgi:hypothetical protein